MGIENRDYARDSPSQNFGSGYGHARSGEMSIVARIIIATVIIFFLQVTIPGVTEWLVMTSGAYENGQVWRFVTYAFCHSQRDILHIIFNMLIFWWLGRELERMYGGREFLCFYLLAAIFAAVVYVVLRLWVSQVNPMLGASGAVMAVEVLYALHFPRVKMLVYGIFPIEIRWLITGLILFDAYPVLRMLAGQPDASGVAHSAHLGGVLFGFLYWRFGVSLTGWFSKMKVKERWKEHKVKNNAAGLRVHRPEESDEFGDRVDEILEKISREGEESLTDKERAFMMKASGEYKKRNH